MQELINSIFSDKKVVIITGAGISTLSGIPDFRGKNGLYTKGQNVEYFLSRNCLIEEPEIFYDFYKNNMIMDEMKPNIIHKTLSRLEQLGYISTIITQNIDNLHELAGSKNIIHLHGDGEKFYCKSCNSKYNVKEYVNNGSICNICGGIIRPDVVLYGERVKTENMTNAINEIKSADIVIVLGSSLLVNTIQNVIDEFINKKGKLFIVNDQATPYDCYGKTYKEDLGMTLRKINKEINNRG